MGYRYVLRALEEKRCVGSYLRHENSRYDVPGHGYQLAHGATCLTGVVAGLPRGVEQPLHAGAPDGMALQRFGRHSPESRFGGLQRDRDPVRRYGREIFIPRPVSFRSPYGLIRSEWSDSPQQYRQRVEIPANTTALVYLPAVDPAAVSESGVPLGEVPGLSVRERGIDYLSGSRRIGHLRFPGGAIGFVAGRVEESACVVASRLLINSQ
ncbi:MAG: alpha-L-rhamnosidase C-terminal domain-containing protein [Alistipes indistinctus]